MTTRSLSVLALLAAFTIAGLVAGWTYTHPAAEAVPWNLTGMGGANSALGDENVGPNIVRVHVEQWPVDAADDSWLTQTVDYRADAVTITLRPIDAYRAQVEGHGLIGMYDTGGWVNVALREPLGGRQLLDGATGQRATIHIPTYPLPSQ